jgi:hypothetical protein
VLERRCDCALLSDESQSMVRNPAWFQREPMDSGAAFPKSATLRSALVLTGSLSLGYPYRRLTHVWFILFLQETWMFRHKKRGIY